MRNQSMSLGLAALALALGLIGCGDSEAVCTQIGCDDGIFLSILTNEGDPVYDFDGEATVGDDSVTFSCVSGAGGDNRYNCMGNVLHLDFDEADEVTIELSSGTDPLLGYTGTVPVEFVESHPNGADCPPVCRQANHMVELVPTQP